jgi:hypothetical protein
VAFEVLHTSAKLISVVGPRSNGINQHWVLTFLFTPPEFLRNLTRDPHSSYQSVEAYLRTRLRSRDAGRSVCVAGPRWSLAPSSQKRPRALLPENATRGRFLGAPGFAWCTRALLGARGTLGSWSSPSWRLAMVGAGHL